MKKFLFALAVLVFCCVAAEAQVSVREVIYSNADPVGTNCVDGKLYVNRLTSVMTGRINGVCTPMTAGGTPGTVTSVSVVTANGLSGSVATATTTPAITLNIAALDATKIAGGGVTSTEFDFLGGVTSDIQTQLGARLPLTGGTLTGGLGFSVTNTLDIGTSATVLAPRTVYAGTSVVSPVLTATTSSSLGVASATSLGIGIVTPTAKLDIFSSAATTVDMYMRSTSASGRTIFQANAGSGVGSGGSLDFRAYGESFSESFFGVDVAGGSSLVFQVNGHAAPAVLGNLSNSYLVLGTNSLERWRITAAGHLLAGTDNSYDIGASGATRPRTGYFGTSVITPLLTADNIGAFTLGGTISGGGNQLNNVIIGTATPLAGSFTTLNASSTTTITGQILNVSAESALTWGASYKAIQLGGQGSLLAFGARQTGADISIGHNFSFDGTNFKYINSEGASRAKFAPTNAALQVAVSGTAGNNITFLAGLSVDNTQTITLNTAVYNTCTALTTTAGVLGCTVSDERVKSHLAPFNNGLGVIRRINPITFQFSKGSQWYKGGRTELGLSAQNLKAADPLLASSTGNTLDLLQPEPLAIHAITVSAIKDLDAKLSALTTRLTALETENERLRRRIVSKGK